MASLTNYNSVIPGLIIYEHLLNIGTIKELEFRQIMEVNRTLEVIGITHKENFSSKDHITDLLGFPPSTPTPEEYLCMFTK